MSSEKPLSFEENVKEALGRIQGRLELHGGGIDLVAANEDTGDVVVRFQGACIGCPLAAQTLEDVIEGTLSDVPGFRCVHAPAGEEGSEPV
jgi:Fe-S cluster biogenesis protein NfuA